MQTELNTRWLGQKLYNVNGPRCTIVINCVLYFNLLSLDPLTINNRPIIKFRWSWTWVTKVIPISWRTPSFQVFVIIKILPEQDMMFSSIKTRRWRNYLIRSGSIYNSFVALSAFLIFYVKYAVIQGNTRDLKYRKTAKSKRHPLCILIGLRGRRGLSPSYWLNPRQWNKTVGGKKKIVGRAYSPNPLLFGKWITDLNINHGPQ